MPKIFISYRRADSQQITSRIYDHLVNTFGETDVFIDVENIPAGVDFRGVLREATADCDFILVVIGKNWVNITDSHGNRRIDDPQDFVRIEVESGLQRENVRVIPLLVEGAQMPSSDDLPDPLKQLAFQNAVIIHNDPVFRDDIARLTRQLNGQKNTRSLDMKWIIGAIIIPLTVAVITILPPLLQSANPSDDPNNIADMTEISEYTATPTEELGSPTADTTTLTTTTQPTLTPTDISQPSPTTLPTATQPPLSKSYPCQGTIIYPDGATTVVNIVYEQPSESARHGESLRVGDIVTIRSESDFGNQEWLYIFEDSRTIGYVLSRYIQKEEQCPN